MNRAALMAVGTGVLTKQVVFGVISLALGFELYLGLKDMVDGIRGRRIELFRAAVRIGMVGLGLYAFLAVLGTPELSWADWHVWYLAIAGLLVIFGIIGAMTYRLRRGKDWTWHEGF